MGVGYKVKRIFLLTRSLRRTQSSRNEAEADNKEANHKNPERLGHRYFLLPEPRLDNLMADTKSGKLIRPSMEIFLFSVLLMIGVELAGSAG
jgi:hypothetical protein